jgi:hypothetical protein
MKKLTLIVHLPLFSAIEEKTSGKREKLGLGSIPTRDEGKKSKFIFCTDLLLNSSSSPVPNNFYINKLLFFRIPIQFQVET